MFVVLGASAAGVSAIKELRRLNPTEEIILISKDENIYSRCILHHYLSDIRTKEEISFVEEDFETKYNVSWKKGVAVVDIKTNSKDIVLSDGTLQKYDKLLIATGSSTFIPPIPNLRNSSNVIGFRNFEDVVKIKEAIKTAENPVILGGGLVGVDALEALVHLGKNVSLVEMSDRLLNIQLDTYSSDVYKRTYENKGAKFYLNTRVDSVELEGDKVSKLILSNGKSVECDLVIAATGTRSNVGFLENCDIDVDDKGLIIDEFGKTNIEGVFGAGDVTGKSPIWPAAVKEGIIAANNMSDNEKALDDFFASKCTMNFLDIPTLSLGLTDKPDESYIVTIKNDGTNYKKIIHKDGKIYGAILQGELSYAGVLTQLIKNKIDVSKVKKPLFDIDYSDFFHIDKNFEFYY